ncbi:MAG: hypothetical protein JXA95_06410 [Spirochaetales bacterium]|nr:hypothetical protein [Spirochaetales bacterium]
MKRSFLPLPALLFMTCFSLFAQYDPQIDWKYIDTEDNRIIFPDYLTAEGVRVASLTEQVYPLITETMQPLHLHIYPIILTGGDMISNGYVTLFPRRSVWYGFPRGYGAGSSDWYDHLAVHEGRHTVQFDYLNSSTAHLLFLLGGETWYSAAIGMTPSWMFEGDAIVTETEFTSQGRGELASFSELMRSLAYEERNYSYAKMHLGSFRDITPSPHAFGYPFMNWLEEEYGPEAAASLFAVQAEWPLPLLGTTFALKDLTGLPPRKAYREMMIDLKEDTAALIAEKGPLKEGERLVPQNRIYTDYAQISLGPEGEWYALKADMLRPSALYRFDDGDEKKLFEPVPATRLDGQGGLFVWDSVSTDAAFPTRQESDLFLRTAEGGIRRLTRGGRYYHPALSEKGRIAVLEYTRERIPRLVIMDREGTILQERDFPDGITFASWPSWEGDNLILLVQNAFGEAIWRFDGKDFTPLTPFTSDDLSHPEPWGGGVFFSLDRKTGREICYLRDGRISQITNSTYGADWPVADEEGNRLLYLRSEGYLGETVAVLPLTGITGIRDIALAPLPSPSPRLAGFSEGNNREYEVKDYEPVQLLSPVGWGITSLGLSGNELEIPFTLISVNPMQTLTWETGLYWNLNEEALNYRLGATLDRFRPSISTDLSLSERERSGVPIKDFQASLGATLPVGNSRGRDSLGLTLTGESFYLRSWTDNKGADHLGFYEEAEFKHSRQGGYRSLQPRFEESLNISLLHTLESDPLIQFNGSGHLLLPGLWHSHGIGLYAYYENNPDLLTSPVPGVRGWDYEAEAEQLMVKAEYLFPLLYPDAALGGLFYLPRISGELFYDRQGTGQDFSAVRSSFGGEILADAGFLSLPILVRGGLRISRLWEREETAYQFVIKGYMINN